MKATPQPHALITDLYELTMAAGYLEHDVRARATFELFVRSLPAGRSCLVAAGLDSVLDDLEAFAFQSEEIEYLRGLPAFRTSGPENGRFGRFFDLLRTLRFTGDVMAVPEGTVVFAGEPLLQVTAPLIEAQVVETLLLATMHFETLVASKAARVVHAAAGRPVVEFGTRRAHGPEAGTRAARAAYIGGCVGTSNLQAGLRWEIPVLGTAAHSWTQVFVSERESFEALLQTYPERAYLLLDTYDTLAAAETAARLHVPVPGVRLDSGDLAALSREVRRIFDRHGHAETKIMASGDLDEWKVAALVTGGAPIDSFGVGTAIATSADAPALSAIYKLVEIEAQGRVSYTTKAGGGKSYAPGSKQVFRFHENGRFHHDQIARAGENVPAATPLLALVMRNGRRLRPAPAVAAVREHALDQWAQLPEAVLRLEGAARYPVIESPALRELDAETRYALLAGQS